MSDAVQDSLERLTGGLDERMGNRSTLVEMGSAQRYQGHDLAEIPGNAIYSVGVNSYAAILALLHACRIREFHDNSKGLPHIIEERTKAEAPMKAIGNPKASLFVIFEYDQVRYRASGIHVPGGVIFTWWR